MERNACRSHRRLLRDLPLPFAHRLIELLERYRAGASSTLADRQIAEVVERAGWTPDFVDRVVRRYRAQPRAIQRAIAGSAFEMPLGDGSLASLLTASCAESYLRRLGERQIADYEERRRLGQEVLRRGGESEREVPAPGERPGKPPQNLGVVQNDGVLVLVQIDQNGVVVRPDAAIPEDPAKRVAWIVTTGFCNEPVFVRDFVLGIGHFRDGRGREGVRLIRRASGLPYVFDEDVENDINKTVYGPNDPGGFLEVDVDFVEIDSPKEVLDAVEAFLSAAEQVGDVLKNPMVSLSAHLAKVILAIIEAVADSDGVDLGNIAPPVYTPQRRIDEESNVDRNKSLKRSQVFGYDFDYRFHFVLKKVGA